MQEESYSEEILSNNKDVTDIESTNKNAKPEIEKYEIHYKPPTTRKMYREQTNKKEDYPDIPLEEQSHIFHLKKVKFLPTPPETPTIVDRKDLQELLNYGIETDDFVNELLKQLQDVSIIRSFINFLRSSTSDTRSFFAADLLSTTVINHVNLIKKYSEYSDRFVFLSEIILKRIKVKTRIENSFLSKIENITSSKLYNIKETSRLIETHLFAKHEHEYKTYQTAAIALLQNIKSNSEIFSKVISGDITPPNLIEMKPSDFANKELKQQRNEIENSSLKEVVINPSNKFFTVNEKVNLENAKSENLEFLEEDEIKKKRVKGNSNIYYFNLKVSKSDDIPCVGLKAVEVPSGLNDDIQMSELCFKYHYNIKSILEKVKNSQISGTIPVEKILNFVHNLINTKRRIIIPFRLANSERRSPNFKLFRGTLVAKRKIAVIDLEQEAGVLYYLFPFLNIQQAINADKVVGVVYAQITGLLGVDLSFSNKEGFENDGFCVCIFDPEKIKRSIAKKRERDKLKKIQNVSKADISISTSGGKNERGFYEESCGFDKYKGRDGDGKDWHKFRKKE